MCTLSCQTLRSRLIAIFVILVAFGCSDWLNPLPPGQSVFVTSGETNELLVVDGSNGRVARRIPLQDAVLHGSFSSDSSQLYLAEGLSTPGPWIALDTKSLRTDWTERQGDPPTPRPDRWGGVAVYASVALRPSPDGRRLYVYPAIRSDSLGIASLDASTRDLIAFGGEPLGLERDGLAMAPAGPGMSSDALLAMGRRASNAGIILWLDPSTLAVMDSATVVDVPGGSPCRLLGSALAPDGHSLYMMCGSSLGLDKYDVRSHSVVTRVQLQTLGYLAVSPDGSAVYLAQRTDDPAAHSTLSVYDSNLDLIATIALPNIDGSPAHVVDVSPNPAGTRVFVLAGTGSRTLLLGGPQPGHLFAVDPSTRQVVWDTPLNLWGSNQLFVR